MDPSLSWGITTASNNAPINTGEVIQAEIADAVADCDLEQTAKAAVRRVAGLQDASCDPEY